MTEQFVMTEHTVVIERVFDAPRELVWAAWTDPDQIAKWWGPEHFTTPREKIEIDLRPGGVCRMTMVGPDGDEFPNDGHFTVVEAPARLAFAEDETDHPMVGASETSVEFVGLDGGATKVVLTSRMMCAEELVAMAEAGWSSQFDKLDRLLASE